MGSARTLLVLSAAASLHGCTSFCGLRRGTSQASHRLLGRRAAISGPASPDELYSKWGVRDEEQTSFKEGGMRFNSKDNDYDVETVDGVIVTRNPSLGIDLLEIASDGSGTGIVVVAGCVPGGAAEKCGALLPGDTIAAVGPVGGPYTSVEARDWDGTVAALGAVETDAIELVLKRLVKRPKVDVVIKYPNDEEPEVRISLFAGENLRRAMLVRGVKLNDPLARRFDNQANGGDCGSEGTCCTCAVSVLAGGDLISEQKSQERQMLNTLREPRWRLACKARVGMDMKPGQIEELSIRINPRQHAQ